MKIFFEALYLGSEKWDRVTNEVAKVSWKAGKHLSEKMKNKQFFDWETVIIGETVDKKISLFLCSK